MRLCVPLRAAFEKIRVRDQGGPPMTDGVHNGTLSSCLVTCFTTTMKHTSAVSSSPHSKGIPVRCVAGRPSVRVAPAITRSGGRWTRHRKRTRWPCSLTSLLRERSRPESPRLKSRDYRCREPCRRCFQAGRQRPPTSKGGIGAPNHPSGREKELTMEAVAIPAPAIVVEDPTPTKSVVSAEGLTRRYGEGETAVDALRGVSLDVPTASSPPSWAHPAPASPP